MLSVAVHFKRQVHMVCDLDYMRGNYFRNLMPYCNFPSQPVIGSEGTLMMMTRESGIYTMESVHTLIRHGDRNNLHKMRNGIPPTLSCMLTEDMTAQHPELKDFLSAMGSQRREPGQTFHNWEVFPHSSVCATGSLTPRGAVQHVLNGAFFKDVYIEDHNLIDVAKFKEQVLVRCTNKSRTFQSAAAFLFGLFPSYDLSTLTIEQADNNSMCTKDMAHSCYCPELGMYLDKMSCHMQIERLEVMNRPLAMRIYQHVSETMGVASNSLPTLAKLLDMSMVHVCHQLPLPGRTDRCIEDWTVFDMNEILIENGATQVKSELFRRVAMVKMIPLLQEIAERMATQVRGDTKVRFVLYSGHDTSIDPLAVALNISDGHWPRYASRIVLELVSYTATKDISVDKKDYYIRVLYDGKLVTHLVSFCRGKIVSHELRLCPFELFHAFVNGGYLELIGATSYTDACAKLTR
ncbi:hypothetical protein NP493_527g01024 [Ridgeia piscesae]|uniref:2-phosphoxylose phosphatase 1 n=1 Tax=Ridgeia piscesae TaxID=27915 RepID=A0AAD9NTH1_RIDPI|nr:hypothetical protein NP493_527g01024 [Ridgeia piscesae]